MAKDADILLGIYLNDHLAGATGGTELARRLAAADDQWSEGKLGQVADEIAEDRATLVKIMTALRVPARQYKVLAGWAGEKVARLKLNGRLFTRSPLSRLVELEAMLLGVKGKDAAWRTLLSRAERDSRLDVAQLRELLERARRQAETLDDLRVIAAAEACG